MNIKSLFTHGLLLVLASTFSTLTLAAPNPILGIQTVYPDIEALGSTDQGCTYDSANGILTITSTPSVLYSPNAIQEFISLGVLVLTANIDTSGNLTSGTIKVTGIAGIYTNPLIEGDLTAYGISENANLDRSDFTFDVTGGSLATIGGYGDSGQGGINVTMESATDSTTSYQDTFNNDWDCGTTKINLGPVPLPPVGPGTGTIGYWKTHPDAWPVAGLTLGDDPALPYSKAKLIEFLQMAVKGDKTVSMAKQLIAAKINVAAGNDSSCIAATIAAADSWLSNNGGIGAKVRQWGGGDLLHDDLDAYNNGLLCAPHRG